LWRRWFIDKNKPLRIKPWLFAFGKALRGGGDVWPACSAARRRAFFEAQIPNGAEIGRSTTDDRHLLRAPDGLIRPA